MAERMPNPPTRFRQSAMPILTQARDDLREKWTRESEIAYVCLVVGPNRILYATDWKFPINLANFIFIEHRIRNMLRRQSRAADTSGITKVLDIVYPRLPREPEDIKFCLAWLEFYAAEGEPPQIHPEASRSYLHRHLRVAEQLGVLALKDHLGARIQELTVMIERRQQNAGETRVEMQPARFPQHRHLTRTVQHIPAIRPSQRRPPSLENVHRTHTHSIQATYAHESLAAHVHGQAATGGDQDTTEPADTAKEDTIMQTEETTQGNEPNAPNGDADRVAPDNTIYDNIRTTDSLSPRSIQLDGPNHLTLQTSMILRSPHTPANSAYSRARSHLTDTLISEENGVQRDNQANESTIHTQVHNGHISADSSDTEMT